MKACCTTSSARFVASPTSHCARGVSALKMTNTTAVSLVSHEQDNRHNFSVYFYHLYLGFEQTSSFFAAVVAFLPQVISFPDTTPSGLSCVAGALLMVFSTGHIAPGLSCQVFARFDFLHFFANLLLCSLQQGLHRAGTLRMHFTRKPGGIPAHAHEY